MILLIDNYDSFTYNLYQYLGEYDKDIRVARNDELTLDDIEIINPDRIVLSPGPKSPKEAGICIELIKKFHKKYPILGICLGHQAIGEAFGADITYAKELYHGKFSVISHDSKGILSGIKTPMRVTRYHSLAIDEEMLPRCFDINSRTDDGEIMAVSHKEYPLFGLQFHPESIYTSYGREILANFVKIQKP